MSLGVLYEDPDVLLVDKPSGMLVHRSRGEREDAALQYARRLAGDHVFAVHRLDRGTSGALLFAKNKESAAVLAAAFAEGRVEKTYLALVRGAPPAEGIVDHPIPRKEGGPRVPARTRFRLVARSPVERCSLVAAMPETGRLHQIRRHLKHLSHPLVGDVNYGKGDINRLYRARYGIHRLALHAAELSFDHPRTGARLRIGAPLPPELLHAFRALGLVER